MIFERYDCIRISDIDIGFEFHNFTPDISIMIGSINNNKY